MPLVPGAVGVAVLEPADEGERRALVAAAGAELQRRMVVEALGALADLAQRIAFATTLLRQKLQTANAEAGDRKSTGAPQFGQAAR
jgi:hypothetical protein